jgi:hypothetical protein
MHLLKNNNNNNKVLLRLLLLLVFSVFIDPDSEACELINDPKPSVISIRHNRSFSKSTSLEFLIILPIA